MPTYPYVAEPPPLTQEELDALAAKQASMGGSVPAGGYIAEPPPTEVMPASISSYPEGQPVEPVVGGEGYQPGAVSEGYQGDPAAQQYANAGPPPQPAYIPESSAYVPPPPATDTEVSTLGPGAAGATTLPASGGNNWSDVFLPRSASAAEPQEYPGRSDIRTLPAPPPSTTSTVRPIDEAAQGWRTIGGAILPGIFGRSESDVPLDIAGTRGVSDPALNPRILGKRQDEFGRQVGSLVDRFGTAIGTARWPEFPTAAPLPDIIGGVSSWGPGIDQFVTERVAPALVGGAETNVLLDPGVYPVGLDPVFNDNTKVLNTAGQMKSVGTGYQKTPYSDRFSLAPTPGTDARAVPPPPVAPRPDPREEFNAVQARSDVTNAARNVAGAVPPEVIAQLPSELRRELGLAAGAQIGKQASQVSLPQLTLPTIPQRDPDRRELSQADQLRVFGREGNVSAYPSAIPEPPPTDQINPERGVGANPQAVSPPITDSATPYPAEAYAFESARAAGKFEPPPMLDREASDFSGRGERGTYRPAPENAPIPPPPPTARVAPNRNAAMPVPPPTDRVNPPPPQAQEPSFLDRARQGGARAIDAVRGALPDVNASLPAVTLPTVPPVTLPGNIPTPTLPTLNADGLGQAVRRIVPETGAVTPQAAPSQGADFPATRAAIAKQTWRPIDVPATIQGVNVPLIGDGSTPDGGNAIGMRGPDGNLIPLDPNLTRDQLLAEIAKVYPGVSGGTVAEPASTGTAAGGAPPAPGTSSGGGGGGRTSGGSSGGYSPRSSGSSRSSSGRSSDGGDSGGLDRDYTADDFLEQAGGNRRRAQQMATAANRKRRAGKSSGTFWEGFPFNRPDTPIRAHVLRAIEESKAAGRARKQNR